MFKTKAAIDINFNEPLIIDEIVLSDPKPEQVIVKLYASGICGSQLFNLQHPKVTRPQLLGHEATGVIVKVGSNVKNLKEGDDVLISWIPFDATKDTDYLQWCDIGWGRKKLKSILFTWSEHTIIHKQFVSPLPKGFEKYSTSIVGCAVSTGYCSVQNMVNLLPGNSVAVFGIGGLGIFALNAAKNLNANPIIAIDINDEKLEYAKTFGATHTINSLGNNVLDEIEKIAAGGVDYAFDMVGVPEVMEISIACTKEGIVGYSDGGTTIVAGFPEGTREYNPRSLLNGQRKYQGSKGGCCIPKKDFPNFYNMYINGELLLDQAITNKYSFNTLLDALDDLSQGKILGKGIIIFD